LLDIVDRRPYKKVAREQAQQRTREALLEAAIEEFYGDRWNKTSLEALSARAGVTKQTLLRHFGSKEGLLIQALVRGAAQVLDERWSAPVGDIDGAIENLLGHYEVWGRRARRIGAWQDTTSVLAKLSKAGRRVHYRWVEFAFGPQLEGLDEATFFRRRAELIVICDVQTWWILSNDLGLPRSEIKAILIGMVERARRRSMRLHDRCGAGESPRGRSGGIRDRPRDRTRGNRGLAQVLAARSSALGTSNVLSSRRPRSTGLCCSNRPPRPGRAADRHQLLGRSDSR
jgi:AcrR family transcriptional regulator